MQYHPILTAVLAQTRTDDLIDAPPRAPTHRRKLREQRQADSPHAIVSRGRLDAYPRLCGLPVSIERYRTVARAEEPRNTHHHPEGVRHAHPS